MKTLCVAGEGNHVDEKVFVFYNTVDGIKLRIPWRILGCGGYLGGLCMTLPVAGTGSGLIG